MVDQEIHHQIAKHFWIKAASSVENGPCFCTTSTEVDREGLHNQFSGQTHSMKALQMRRNAGLNRPESENTNVQWIMLKSMEFYPSFNSGSHNMLSYVWYQPHTTTKRWGDSDGAAAVPQFLCSAQRTVRMPYVALRHITGELAAPGLAAASTMYKNQVKSTKYLQSLTIICK